MGSFLSHFCKYTFKEMKIRIGKQIESQLVAHLDSLEVYTCSWTKYYISVKHTVFLLLTSSTWMCSSFSLY